MSKPELPKAGAWLIPTKAQHDAAYELAKLCETREEDGACFAIIYGYTQNERVHPDLLRIVDGLINKHRRTITDGYVFFSYRGPRGKGHVQTIEGDIPCRVRTTRGNYDGSEDSLIYDGKTCIWQRKHAEAVNIDNVVSCRRCRTFLENIIKQKTK